MGSPNARAERQDDELRALHRSSGLLVIIPTCIDIHSEEGVHLGLDLGLRKVEVVVGWAMMAGKRSGKIAGC
jgi:hypothetical protein